MVARRQDDCVFRYVDDRTATVLLISPLGGRETRLGPFYTRRYIGGSLDIGGSLASLCWSADSRDPILALILTASEKPDDPSALLRVDVGTRAVTTLATLPPADGYAEPSLSPTDGRSPRFASQVATPSSCSRSRR